MEFATLIIATVAALGAWVAVYLSVKHRNEDNQRLELKFIQNAGDPWGNVDMWNMSPDPVRVISITYHFKDGTSKDRELSLAIGPLTHMQTALYENEVPKDKCCRVTVTDNRKMKYMLEM